MNHPILENLHIQFSAALDHGKYIGQELKENDDKRIRLQTVFQLASTEIQKACSNPPKPLQNIEILRALEEDGKLLYERYEKTSKRWIRIFLKGLARFTPEFLKNYLPQCFTNRIVLAESKTKEQFEEYKKRLSECIAKLEQVEIEKQDSETKKLETPQTEKDSTEEKEEDEWCFSDEEDVFSIFHEGYEDNQLGMEEAPSPSHFTYSTDPEDESDLEDVSSPKVEKLGAGPIETPDQMSGNMQQAHFLFGTRKLGNQKGVLIKNEEGKSIRENELRKYSGVVRLSLISDLNELVDYMKMHPDCRPSSVEIQMGADESLSEEQIKLFIALCEFVSEIRLLDLKDLDFKKLNLSPGVEENWMKVINRFHFPHLYRFLLSSTVSPKHFPLILKQFRRANHLTLSGLEVKDKDLQKWIKKGYLDHVKELDLAGCQSLTTDILPSLISLPSLSQLFLPDLPKGKVPILALPKLDNPFKVKFFYLASKETRKAASSLYTGPQIWASVFQIPLARAGEDHIFSPKHQILDPKSVALWLHRSDFSHLKPQASITAILADSNSALNDENIAAFVGKFPNAKGVSLFNCPNITSRGILRLLESCPHIRRIDLTGCRQIAQEGLFDQEGSLKAIAALEAICITDTGISEIEALSLKEKFGKVIGFEKTALKITDDQLTDEEALGKILSSLELNHLTRIDLEGCTKLTNAMLGRLLDHLNAPIWIKGEENETVENPQRLNMALLNLSGCSQITDEAFTHAKVAEKIEPKLLENLDRIVIGGTQISGNGLKVLKNVYSQVSFQEIETPITLQVDAEAQFQACQMVQEMKKRASLDDQNVQSALTKLSREYVHNRITIDLFYSECKVQERVNAVLQQPIDTSGEEFCDITLCFRTHLDSTPVRFQTHRDILYCQSPYFLKKLRPGGMMSKLCEPDFTNVHATPDASQVLMDIFYEKAGLKQINKLDWKVAADAAELVGPIFRMRNPHYQALLKRIHSQFEYEQAFEMLTAAVMLKDKEGMRQYEDFLLLCLEDITQLTNLANLAVGFGLKRLKEQTDQIQNEQTEARIAEAAVADMIAEEDLDFAGDINLQ